jgi:FtsZ-interacting cell division protein YlmF
MIGCGCEVCKSTDPRDKRLRASVLVKHEGLRILVDAGPDFRYQMLRAGVSSLDAILLTHNHKDHTGGLDDIRAFNYLEKKATQIYCEKYVEESLRKEYSYAFEEIRYPGAPEWDVHIIDDKPFTVNGVEIIPIRGRHFKLPVLGYRFGNIAYCTDMNHIPDEEYENGYDEYGYAEEEDDDYEEVATYGNTSSSRSSSNSSSSYRKNKVVNISATAKLQVAIFKPERFGEETRVIADELIKTHTVVLNLEETNKDMARRIVDFLSGVAYAHRGKIKRVATSTFIIIPNNVDLTGDDLLDELENSGVYF